MVNQQQLGFRSRLVLEKLGFDLRPYLDETLTAPLPTRMQLLVDELGGYAEWRDVGEAPIEPPPSPVARTAWAMAGDTDGAFQFG